MTSSRRNSVSWKEEVKMSDMAAEYKAPNNLKTGLLAFGDEIKKLIVIGIIVPLLMMLPSIYMQTRWVKYDKIIDKQVTEEYTSDPFSDLTEEEMDFINEMENGSILYELKIGVSFAAFILWGALIVLAVGNLIKSFFGEQAEMTLGVPCKKTILFAGKFVSTMIVMGIAFFLFEIQTNLMDYGIKFRDGGFYKIIDSYGKDGESLIKLIRSYEPVEFGGFVFSFMMVMVIWLGLAFLMALIGKLQKHYSSALVAVIIVIATILVLFVSVATLYYGDTYNSLLLMLVAPVLLFVADLLMVRDYDRVSS